MQWFSRISTARYTENVKIYEVCGEHGKKRALLFFLPICLAILITDFSAAAQTQAPASAAHHYAYGSALHLPGIPNSAKVNEHLYRGAQPRDPGMLELKKLGINTIVDLRGEDKGKMEWEKKRAESLGIHFVDIPVSGWAPPSDEQVAQFLAIFRDSPQEKVFVHCRFGDDRTGVFVATYRMAYEHFPADEALKEMHRFGFNSFWHPSMIVFVRNFPTHLESSPALATFKRKE